MALSQDVLASSKIKEKHKEKYMELAAQAVAAAVQSMPGTAHPIKHIAPPTDESVPEIIFGWWKTSNDGELFTWGEVNKPNLKLSRNLEDAVRAGAKEVMLFKFERMGTINIEVK